jgi:ribonuclease P protein component
MSPGSTPALRLPRSQRVKQGRDFARLKRLGRRVTRGCLVANWQELAPGEPSRVGIITTRKLGNAVARSRARRLLRESFRLHQFDLRAPVEMVLVARLTIASKKLADVEADFLAAARQARLLKDSI